MLDLGLSQVPCHQFIILPTIIEKKQYYLASYLLIAVFRSMLYVGPPYLPAVYVVG